jgi:integrase/recombinase XerD
VSDNHLTKYISYLKYEKNLTDNSVDAYLRDLQKLARWAEGRASSVADLGQLDLEAFLCSLHDVGITPTSQRRILSGIKSYYRFLQLDHVIERDPSELIEAPKVGQHLPTVLTLEEVNRVIAQPDVSTPLGQRNRAILETLYSCGVRVSELIGLRISNIYEKEGYIRVDGKGRKQRIVPIAESALREIHNYFLFRYEMDVKPGSEDIVFLNRFGGAMTRMAVFNIIKQYCAAAGIQKEVSPHTFRHTFATHLLEGGANLRAIQMMLGHEQISTTEIYSQVDRQFLKEEILAYHPRNKS